MIRFLTEDGIYLPEPQLYDWKGEKHLFLSDENRGMKPIVPYARGLRFPISSPGFHHEAKVEKVLCTDFQTP